MKREQIGVVALYMYQQPPVPYKAIMVGKFRCSECNTEILAQFADNPFWECFHDEDAPNQNSDSVFVVYEKPTGNKVEPAISQVQIGGKGNIQSIS